MKDIRQESIRRTAYLRQIALVVFIIAMSCVMSGCSSKKDKNFVPETRYVVVDRPAQIPPGVVRYCWEEPIVEMERNGPGVDLEGHWYHPFYIAVREVRQGRWRPCRPMESELKGETRNER